MSFFTGAAAKRGARRSSSSASVRLPSSSGASAGRSVAASAPRSTELRWAPRSCTPSASGINQQGTRRKRRESSSLGCIAGSLEKGDVVERKVDFPTSSPGAL